MPQINRFLYFEYDDGVNPIRTIGDKYVPKTIALTGPNKVEKRLNDVTTDDPAKQILSIGASGDIASYSFAAFRSSVAGTLSWEGTAGGDDTSSIQMTAGEWVVFLSDDTTAHGAGTGADRAVGASQAITGFWWNSSSPADIDVLAFS